MFVELDLLTATDPTGRILRGIRPTKRRVVVRYDDVGVNDFSAAPPGEDDARFYVDSDSLVSPDRATCRPTHYSLLVDSIRGDRRRTTERKTSAR